MDRGHPVRLSAKRENGRQYVFKGPSACGAGRQDVRALFLSQEIFPNRREDVYQNHLLVKHCRPMPGAGRKVEHVTGRRDTLFVANRKDHAATLDDGHLFVRMIVRGRNNIGLNEQATNHQVLPDDHLALNTRFQLFDRNTAPVCVLWLQFFDGFHFSRSLVHAIAPMARAL
jgi:hypothetical protein